MSWSADGTHLLFMVIDPVTNWDIWQYSFADRKATPLLNALESEGFPQFSPDGRWFAYSVHTGTAVQLFVEWFPRGRGKWQVPSEMAHYPRWRADGRELFFLRPGPDQSGPWAAMSVDVRGAGAGLELGPPRRLFDAPGIYGVWPGIRVITSPGRSAAMASGSSCSSPWRRIARPSSRRW
jgi:hypothetical protein